MAGVGGSEDWRHADDALHAEVEHAEVGIGAGRGGDAEPPGRSATDPRGGEQRSRPDHVVRSSKPDPRAPTASRSCRRRGQRSALGGENVLSFVSVIVTADAEAERGHGRDRDTKNAARLA